MAIKKLEIPLLGDIHEAEARIALAAELYREGKLTLQQAADTAQVITATFEPDFERMEFLEIMRIRVPQPGLDSSGGVQVFNWRSSLF